MLAISGWNISEVDVYGKQHSNGSPVGRVVVSTVPHSLVDCAGMGMEQHSQRAIYPETTDSQYWQEEEKEA